MACSITHLWQTIDKFVDKGLFASFLYHFFSDIRRRLFPLGAYKTILDVLVDSGVEEERLLLHKPNL